MSLIGYRWWYAGFRAESGWRLRSLTAPVWWDGPHLQGPTPRVHCPNTCTVNARQKHVTCYCGIHAFKSERLALDQPPVDLPRNCPDGDRFYPVFGVVALWGHLVEHLGGYRAEHAIVRQLTVPRRFVACGPPWFCISDDWPIDLEPPDPTLDEALGQRYDVEVTIGPEICDR